jgi:hypothetical protein
MRKIFSMLIVCMAVSSLAACGDPASTLTKVSVDYHVQRQTMVLVSFNREITPKGAFTEMVLRGLRPATIYDCLAFMGDVGIKDPNIALSDSPLVCLGGPTQVGSMRGIPALEVQRGPMMIEYLGNGVFGPRISFLAVRA